MMEEKTSIIIQQEEYAAVDIFKLICACLVILIHTKPFENNFLLDSAIGMFTRFAVPYFFTISGYFLFCKIDATILEDRGRIVRTYLFRLIRFYVIWFVILRSFDYILSGQKYTVRYYIKQFFFTTDGSALWFVEALIWATIIVVFLDRVINRITIFIIGIGCLLIGYCFSTLLGITGGWQLIGLQKPVFDFIGVQGGSLFAFPYVAMGALLAKYPTVPRLKRDILLTGVFFWCLGIESIIMVIKLQAPLTFIWLSAVPMIWFTTRTTLTVVIKDKPVYYMFRKISTLCFVLHVPIYKLLQIWFRSTNIYEFDTMNLILTGLTMTTTILVALCLLILYKKRQFYLLRYLI